MPTISKPMDKLELPIKLQKCTCGVSPKKILKTDLGGLVMAEWWLNSNHHCSLQTTSFEVFYCYKPPMLLNYIPRFTLNQVVENHLKHRTKILQNNIQNLLKVQNRPKIQADKRRKDKKYKEGDWVYLKH